MAIVHVGCVFPVDPYDHQRDESGASNSEVGFNSETTRQGEMTHLMMFQLLEHDFPAPKNHWQDSAYGLIPGRWRRDAPRYERLGCSLFVNFTAVEENST